MWSISTSGAEDGRGLPLPVAPWMLDPVLQVAAIKLSLMIFYRGPHGRLTYYRKWRQGRFRNARHVLSSNTSGPIDECYLVHEWVWSSSATDTNDTSVFGPVPLETC